MLTLSRQTDYALQFVAALTRVPEGASLSIREFARQSTLSSLFLQRIAIRLKRSGIVSATKGSTGGYRLARPAAEFTVQDVVEAIEGPVSVTLCVSKPGACAFEHKCRTKKVVSKINYQIAQLLRNVPLTELT
ncbi:MAG: Rrf2 family transcriptional regulator [Patescibacteria group bacterium]